MNNEVTSNESMKFLNKIFDYFETVAMRVFKPELYALDSVFLAWPS